MVCRPSIGSPSAKGWRSDQSAEDWRRARLFQIPRRLCRHCCESAVFPDSDNWLLRGANDFLAQTGLRFNRNLALLTGIGLSVAFFVILGAAFGFGLLTLVCAVIATAAAAFLFLATVRKKRIARFGEQLPDAVDVIVRGVRVGFPFSAAMDLVAREMPDPVGTEFAIVSDEIAFGLDMRTAIRAPLSPCGSGRSIVFCRGRDHPDRNGRKSCRSISRLATLIRQRIKLRLKVNAITAEGRLSAVVLSLVPFVLFGIVSVLAQIIFPESATILLRCPP